MFRAMLVYNCLLFAGSSLVRRAAIAHAALPRLNRRVWCSSNFNSQSTFRPTSRYAGPLTPTRRVSALSGSIWKPSSSASLAVIALSATVTNTVVASSTVSSGRQRKLQCIRAAWRNHCRSAHDLAWYSELLTPSSTGGSQRDCNAVQSQHVRKIIFRPADTRYHYHKHGPGGTHPGKNTTIGV
ncbi:hypothetical protein BDZ91DRAFT_379776 [Kalaharituber pfeilii]|nr:hypothetical protein BDZ91DRAFT_379776 [Kalaharituber pfeilii]